MTVCPVTVNNNSVTPVTCRVLVTPLSGFQPPVSLTPTRNSPPVNVVNKVMLKAVSKDKNHLLKMFQLRNINSKEVLSSNSFRSLIRAQLQDDIISEYFDVGYMNGNNCASIGNKEDLWNNVQKGMNMFLWCDGLRSGGAKRKLARGEEVLVAKRSQVDNVQEG